MKITIPTKERCLEKVFPNEPWGGFHPYQCHKTVWKDGFCKIHHPDSVKMREEKSRRRWEEKQKRDPLAVALKTISQLKKENEELKKQIKNFFEDIT